MFADAKAVVLRAPGLFERVAARVGATNQLQVSRPIGMALFVCVDRCASI